MKLGTQKTAQGIRDISATWIRLSELNRGMNVTRVASVVARGEVINFN